MDNINQKIRTEVSFESYFGKTVTRRKEFFESGILFRDGLYIKGHAGWNSYIPLGQIKTHYDTGQIKCEESYDEFGNKDGDFKFYDRKGNLIKTISYKKDTLIQEEVYEASEPV